MSFVGDLKEGNDYEDRVRRFLSYSYPFMELQKNPSRLGIDIISPYWANVEVKFDRMMDTTGNIFIEFECNWNPSWIYKYPFLHLFAYWTNKYFYLFNWNKLQKDIKKFIAIGKYRIVKWWDGWRSKWMLIPECELIDSWIAVRKFYL